MDNIRKVFHIAGNNFKKWAVNPRMYVILLLLIGFLNTMLAPISSFCESAGYKIAPVLFPFLMTEPYTFLMVYLGLILLFCDAPFIESEQPYIITRAGRKLWTAGQLTYIALASAVYFFAVILVSILPLLPNVEVTNEWGRIIKTLAQGGAMTAGIVIPFDKTIIAAFDPVQAMLLQYFLCWLLGCLIGAMMFVLNLLVSRSAGAILAVAIAISPLFVRSTHWIYHYFFPASWVSLKVLDITGRTQFPSLTYGIVGLLILNLLFALAAMFAMRRRDIDVLKSV